MNELAVAALAFMAVVGIGGGILAARSARKQSLQGRLDEKGEEKGEASLEGRMAGAVERLAATASWGRASPRLREELTRAGYHGPNAAKLYLGAKTLLLIVGLVGLSVLLAPFEVSLPMLVVMVIGGAAMLSFIPNFVVRVHRANRTREIRSHLPDALDLLEICVSSGMGLDMAWNAVTDEFRGVNTMLADEMALTNLELHLGSPRATAMRRMAERTGADEVSSLVAMLVQSERFGTSVSEALRTFAGTMREKRSQRAAEAAEKMAVKLLLPMVLFIFPTVFIVMVGPAAVSLAEVMGGGS